MQHTTVSASVEFVLSWVVRKRTWRVLVGVITAGTETECCTLKTVICVCCCCCSGDWNQSARTAVVAPWLGSGWHKAMPPVWFTASMSARLNAILGWGSWVPRQSLAEAGPCGSTLVTLHHPGKESEPGLSSPCCCWSWKQRWPSSLWLDVPPWIAASSSSWPTGGTVMIPAMLSAFLHEQGPPLHLLMITTV